MLSICLRLRCLICIYRFVRFVSTPEVLERVYTLESEIQQIEEAIAIQGNSETALSAVSIIIHARRTLISIPSCFHKCSVSLLFVMAGRRQSGKTDGKHRRYN